MINFKTSVSQFSRSVMSNSLQPHGLQHARPSCPSPTPGAYPNSCPSSQWCHPTISSSVIPFSFHLQSFPASGSFPMSQLFTSGGQSVEVSASTSVLPNKQVEKKQPWHKPFPIWNQSVVPYPVLTVTSWPAYKFLKRQVRWSGVPISLRIFHSLWSSTQSKALV